MALSEVVVYSKPGCCLCEEVKAQLRRLQQDHRFEWREVNILEDPETFEQLKDEIPVVFINGDKAFKYHLKEEDFLKRLRSAGFWPRVSRKKRGEGAAQPRSRG